MDAKLDGATTIDSSPPLDAGPDSPIVIPGLRVFTSSMTYTGNLGGLAGADAKCKLLAQSAGLGSGTWVAWLSTNTTFAKDRITSAGPWTLVGLAGIAVTKAQLTAPPLGRPLRRNENGQAVNGLVWTGTAPNGTFTDDDCNDWTTEFPFFHAASGDSLASGDVWTAATASDCQTPHRLYCFEL